MSTPGDCTQAPISGIAASSFCALVSGSWAAGAGGGGGGSPPPGSFVGPAPRDSRHAAKSSGQTRCSDAQSAERTKGIVMILAGIVAVSNAARGGFHGDGNILSEVDC
jgi:hypothetical protein